MNLNTVMEVEEKVGKYTEEWKFMNEVETLNVMLIAKIGEEDKEFLLNDIDKCLPFGINFSHEYKNDKLKVIFKELQ